jgi:hypothetical protein
VREKRGEERERDEDRGRVREREKRNGPNFISVFVREQSLHA